MAWPCLRLYKINQLRSPSAQTSYVMCLSNIGSCHMAAQFSLLLKSNGDRNFFIVGNTLLNCLPKNLYAREIPVNFDGVLVNSRIARQGSLFSLLYFFIMYFICFTADSAIPLEFGISSELGFHMNPYLWASSLIIWLLNSGPPSLTTSSGMPYEMFPYQCDHATWWYFSESINHSVIGEIIHTD